MCSPQSKVAVARSFRNNDNNSDNNNDDDDLVRTKDLH